MIKRIIITISVLLVVAGALFGISRIEPVRMYIDEQIAYYNKIKEIKEKLDKEIHRNMFLANDEEYEITSIKVTKLEKLPLSEEDYNKYHINKNTIPFVFTIKSASGEEDTLYILYRDEITKDDYKILENADLYDYLRKFSIITASGDDMPVSLTFHDHKWVLDPLSPGPNYYCEHCIKTKMAYDFPSQSLVSVSAEVSEEELDSIIEKETAQIKKGIKQAFEWYVRFKGYSSYEITSLDLIKEEGSLKNHQLYFTINITLPDKKELSFKLHYNENRRLVLENEGDMMVVGKPIEHVAQINCPYYPDQTKSIYDPSRKIWLS